MWQKGCPAAVLVLGALAIQAQAQVPLQWKWKEGETFYLETSGTTKQTMKVMGNPVEQEFETRTLDSYRVVSKAADRIILEKKIEAMNVKATGQGADRASQSAQKVKGAVFTLTLDPRTNTITKVEGVAAFVKKAFGDDPLMQQTMAATLNDESLRAEQQNVLTVFLFDRPVAKGQKWTRKSTIPLGPIGDFSSDGEFTYQGKGTLHNREVDRIDATWTLTYAPPQNKGGLPFTISKGSFQTPTAKATYFFDAAAGKLVQSDRLYNMKGTLTLSVIGQDVEMEMEMSQVSKIRLLDKPPGLE